MQFETLTELAQKLHKKIISSVEVTQFFLDRIAKYNKDMKAFISVQAEQALAQAKQADQDRSCGKVGALHGIPIAHKDIFCTKEIPTTCGSKMLQDFVPPFDATVVERCKLAGLVSLGKTNMDEFAMGSSNETSYFGACSNPWDNSRVPGGSSGGSAAAVAAGLVPAAMGTDTGGSIRQPASFCGITGLKPSYGRVSRWGMIAFASSLDQAGPMARTAEDVALLLNAIAGPDVKDATCLAQPAPDFTAELTQSIKGKKVGLLPETFYRDLSTPVAESVQQGISLLYKLGAECVEIELPHLKLSMPAYYVIAPAECSSNLARYDGVRFGYRCSNPTSIEDLYLRSRGEGFGDEVKRRILMGTYVLSAGFYDAYYRQAQKIRALIKQDFLAAFNQVDVILTPTTPTTAFSLGAKVDPIAMYSSDVFTIAANLCGLPALSMPLNLVSGLPIGLQLIAPFGAEGALLNVAHQLQQQSDWHLVHPEMH